MFKWAPQKFEFEKSKCFQKFGPKSSPISISFIPLSLSATKGMPPKLYFLSFVLFFTSFLFFQRTPNLTYTKSTSKGNVTIVSHLMHTPYRSVRYWELYSLPSVTLGTRWRWHQNSAKLWRLPFSSITYFLQLLPWNKATSPKVFILLNPFPKSFLSNSSPIF